MSEPGASEASITPTTMHTTIFRDKNVPVKGWYILIIEQHPFTSANTPARMLVPSSSETTDYLAFILLKKHLNLPD